MEKFIGLGVVGNFAKHLEQAGEIHTFINMKHIEKDAPKGLFPFYLPHDSGYLGRYCIDNQYIIVPDVPDLHVQAEPEIALECEILYNKEGFVEDIVPSHFMAFNDTSIRNLQAEKLSEKKNFSKGSKGMGEKLLIDRFVYGGVCNDYSIASFLTREGTTHVYGENSKLVKYEYFYDKLLSWIVEMLNTQKNEGSLEDLHHLLKEQHLVQQCIITIGATPYMPFAQENFLQKGDVVTIIAYNHRRYSFEKIFEVVSTQQLGKTRLKAVSYVQQEVVLEGDLR
ncbi:DUF5718 family protein [Helicobacter baculiformis]|uniref:DUF5718 family protein n=1 Tax=Helicobacter baculiformis TaxID=427351 RepID=A0A1M4NGR1_9HELI|nr:DUF5718 family protein [Helicobacter baculiformis]SFZ71397.1 OMP633 [Helicobacter baculiformis]